MKTYNYLRKLPVSIHHDSLDKKDYIEASELNLAVQAMVIKYTELLHGMRTIKFIATDYDLKMRLQDVLRAIHETANKNLQLFGEEVDK